MLPEVINRAKAASALLGRPLKVTSGFRDEASNAARGGAKGSRHIHGDALDVTVKGQTDAERTDTVAALIAAGFKRIGAYSGNTGLHVDMLKQGSPSHGDIHAMFDTTAKNMGNAPKWFTDGIAKGRAMLKSTRGKTLVANKDGSVSSERSITFMDTDGQWVNYPSMHDGKQLSLAEASERYHTQKGKLTEGEDYQKFPSLNEAVQAAKARSAKIGEGLAAVAGEDDPSGMSVGPLRGVVDPRFSGLTYSDLQTLRKQAYTAATQKTQQQKDFEKQQKILTKREAKSVLQVVRQSGAAEVPEELQQRMYKYMDADEIIDFETEYEAAGESLHSGESRCSVCRRSRSSRSG